MNEPWLKKTEVAAELRVSVSSIERHIRPTSRVGGQNRYLMSDVRRQIMGEAKELPDNVTPIRQPIGGRAA